MTSFRPHPALRHRVAAIDVVETHGGDLTVLPSAGAVLGFQFRGRVRADGGLLSTAGVTGIQVTARKYAYLGDTGSILVRFTAQGAACLGVPSASLTGQSVALHDLLPAQAVDELEERLVGASHASERVGLVEKFLIGLPFVHDALIARALDLIAASSGEDAVIASVARALSLSERQLERRFLQRVGLTPKRYAMLLRFERALKLAKTAPSLTRVALDAGYYDQSHFIREFRRFAGRVPSDVLRAPAEDVGFVQSPWDE